MDEAIIAIIIALATSVIGYFIGWSKKKGYDIKMEDMYVKYKLFFNVFGMVVKAIDEKLYEELEQAMNSMKQAYESPEFTTEAFHDVLNECSDVFDRASELINTKKSEQSESS